MVITGDLAQSDRIENNGLKDFIYRLKNNTMPENFNLIEMEDIDVQRSKLVNDVLTLYRLKQPDNKIKIIEPSKQHLIERNSNKTDLIKATENVNNDAALIPRKHLVERNSDKTDLIKATENGSNDAALIPRKHMYKTY